jgi:predicted GIY-YIG superfamily endonuclease
MYKWWWYKKKKKSLIGYILELENKKYYVGYSSYGTSRINQHFRGCGAQWTQKHKPLHIMLTKKITGTKDDALKWEKDTTLQMMSQHGWENVRGAAWCQRNLKMPPISLRTSSRMIARQSTSSIAEGPVRVPS